MTDKARIKAIMFTLGDEERETTGHIIARRVRRRGFRTARGAIKRLLLDCLAACNEARAAEFTPACCKRALSAATSPRHCPECGARLAGKGPASREELADFLRSLNTEQGEVPAEVYNGLLSRGWELGIGLPPSGDVVSIDSLDDVAEGRDTGYAQRFHLARKKIKNAVIAADYLGKGSG